MLVKIIHLDEPRTGSRTNKSDVEYWYRKTRYQKMEDEINDFIRKISIQGYNVVDLKINWQSNTATVLYEAGMDFHVPGLIDDKKTKSPTASESDPDWDIK